MKVLQNNPCFKKLFKELGAEGVEKILSLYPVNKNLKDIINDILQDYLKMEAPKEIRELYEDSTCFSLTSLNSLT